MLTPCVQVHLPLCTPCTLLRYISVKVNFYRAYVQTVNDYIRRSVYRKVEVATQIRFYTLRYLHYSFCMHVCNMCVSVLRGKVRVYTSVHHGNAIILRRTINQPRACTTRGYYVVLTFTCLHAMQYTPYLGTNCIS